MRHRRARHNRLCSDGEADRSSAARRCSRMNIAGIDAAFLAPADAAQALALQAVLRTRAVLEDRFGSLRTVAGVDAVPEPGTGAIRAAAVLLEYPSLRQVGQAVAVAPAPLPYIPGLLSFREAPAMLAALGRLRPEPDIVFVDGHGIAHPRRCGIATHLGVLADVATIGVGKSRLVGHYSEPPDAPGAWTPLRHRGETVGAVLRTRAHVKPLFVSPGHRIGFETALRLVIECGSGFRLPQPTRLADRLSRAAPRGPGHARDILERDNKI